MIEVECFDALLVVIQSVYNSVDQCETCTQYRLFNISTCFIADFHLVLSFSKCLYICMINKDKYVF